MRLIRILIANHSHSRYASALGRTAALGMNLALAAVALPFAWLAFKPSLSTAPAALLVKVNENHYH